MEEILHQLKSRGWKTSVSFEEGLFARGELLVLGSVILLPFTT